MAQAAAGVAARGKVAPARQPPAAGRAAGRGSRLAARHAQLRVAAKARQAHRVPALWARLLRCARCQQGACLRSCLQVRGRVLSIKVFEGCPKLSPHPSPTQASLQVCLVRLQGTNGTKSSLTGCSGLFPQAPPHSNAAMANKKCIEIQRAHSLSAKLAYISPSSAAIFCNGHLNAVLLRDLRL